MACNLLALLRGDAQQHEAHTPCGAGFLLALLTERCLFVDFAPFHTFFTHELDFAWERHQTRLAAAAHDVASRTYTLEHSRAGYNAFAEEWMFQDFRESLRGWQEVVLLDDLDYSAALLQSNPHYQVWRPTPASSSSLDAQSCRDMPGWLVCAQCWGIV